jgi:hypothetical protein
MHQQSVRIKQHSEKLPYRQADFVPVCKPWQSSYEQTILLASRQQANATNIFLGNKDSKFCASVINLICKNQIVVLSLTAMVWPWCVNSLRYRKSFLNISGYRGWRNLMIR